MSVTNPEPTAAALCGPEFPRTAKRLFMATRPMFLTASILPVVLGTAWGVSRSGSLDLVAFLLALIAIVLVHSGVNVLNDVYDETGGTDPANTDRIFPFTGGSRFIQNQVMTVGEMFNWGVALLAASLLIGLVLVLRHGVEVVWMGIAGILIGVVYSAPPIRLSGQGLGEVAVGLGFGILPVTGAAWLQSGQFDIGALALSIPVAIWGANILLINGVPDAEADGATGKRTLVVRIGTQGTLWLYSAVNVIAALAVILTCLAGYMSLIAALVPAILAILAVLVSIRTGRTQVPLEHWIDVIKTTLAIHALGTLWLTGWAWFA